jgi:hypothetical protein
MAITNIAPIFKGMTAVNLLKLERGVGNNGVLAANLISLHIWKLNPFGHGWLTTTIGIVSFLKQTENARGIF